MGEQPATAATTSPALAKPGSTVVDDEASSSTSATKNPLSARELEWANNPPELLKQHQEANGSIIRTRFPPEPNGYLHVGESSSTQSNQLIIFASFITNQKYNRPLTKLLLLHSDFFLSLSLFILSSLQAMPSP
jgi:tRNA synthetases class I (E and Q), catalytic domain